MQKVTFCTIGLLKIYFQSNLPQLFKISVFGLEMDCNLVENAGLFQAQVYMYRHAGLENNH